MNSSSLAAVTKMIDGVAKTSNEVKLAVAVRAIDDLAANRDTVAITFDDLEDRMAEDPELWESVLGPGKTPSVDEMQAMGGSMSFWTKRRGYRAIVAHYRSRGCLASYLFDRWSLKPVPTPESLREAYDLDPFVAYQCARRSRPEESAALLAARARTLASTEDVPLHEAQRLLLFNDCDLEYARFYLRHRRHRDEDGEGDDDGGGRDGDDGGDEVTASEVPWN
ncbi:MAG: hypothetical protein ACYCOU_02945 [Sulfobacillus sp.]